MVRVRNPNFEPPEKARPKAAAAAVAAHVNGLAAGVATITFDDIRAAVPALAAALDGEVHQALADAGMGDLVEIEP